MSLQRHGHDGTDLAADNVRPTKNRCEDCGKPAVFADVGKAWVGCPGCGQPGRRIEPGHDAHECPNVKCLVLSFLDPHDTPRPPRSIKADGAP